ncbi:uncharacterized protein BDR25DRAFT_359456 [Lindgomyces ingoldianus]|uniref:Uncharacterized protein n=1 Tax=Lindgomyces ingoldianus TaxID=673940 RepID=A0ACB6QI08_9PLEO|nr:uncharacterized protein BDR25DRAFT_359456 [Lindgomyces ingoldianus]KAF2466561.1 hypothetical protein BDR25DRAFT_359456 [Lindgomyces ingoldianus]
MALGSTSAQSHRHCSGCSPLTHFSIQTQLTSPNYRTYGISKAITEGARWFIGSCLVIAERSEAYRVSGSYYWCTRRSICAGARCQCLSERYNVIGGFFSFRSGIRTRRNQHPLLASKSHFYISMVDGPKFVIIDWEFSGWYPSYWEYSRALFGYWIEQALKPFRSEYAWLLLFLIELFSRCSGHTRSWKSTTQDVLRSTRPSQSVGLVYMYLIVFPKDASISNSRAFIDPKRYVTPRWIVHRIANTLQQGRFTQRQLDASPFGVFWAGIDADSHHQRHETNSIARVTIYLLPSLVLLVSFSLHALSWIIKRVHLPVPFAKVFAELNFWFGGERTVIYIIISSCMLFLAIVDIQFHIVDFFGGGILRYRPEMESLCNSHLMIWGAYHLLPLCRTGGSGGTRSLIILASMPFKLSHQYEYFQPPSFGKGCKLAIDEVYETTSLHIYNYLENKANGETGLMGPIGFNDLQFKTAEVLDNAANLGEKHTTSRRAQISQHSEAAHMIEKTI